MTIAKFQRPIQQQGVLSAPQITTTLSTTAATTKATKSRAKCRSRVVEFGVLMLIKFCLPCIVAY